ncbi:MAG TPA: adenosylcobalamin-dependent ribonucleoside-diphosphate reductase [Phycisphaerae bacterium]|nr:adenosylcobalamin-dependent ribonucleoside-diphosphate reductase [Phycisphaerae bacterium]HUT61825.1 adenosylcobalamin-dependent ribonucleoside-diphosphate reductase [Phycisphaerae bacterium]
MSEPLRLSENAVRTLETRYLQRDGEGNVVETPEQMFRRVANVIAAAEAAYGAGRDRVAATAEDIYNLMARSEFLPNSPTLMNAGRPLGVLSACFVLPIPDSVDGIFDSVKHTAQIQKAGGGTGFSFDQLRPTGDTISSSGGQTSGPISFWRVFCEATRAIQQGAFRRGANMGMMSVDHPDILKFIAAKSNPAAFENFNISVKVPASFMDALRRQGHSPHVVTNSRTGRRYLLPRAMNVDTYGLPDLPAAEGAAAQDVYTRGQIWDLIVRSAWATGDPGLCFIDRLNEDNPTPALGRIEATNPCGEQPLLDYEACNLGSIDVSRFVRDGHLDSPALRRCIRLCVRILDDVIDVNNYIIPQIEHRCKGNRKIGLGIMGFADALFELGIRYDSEQGLAFGRQLAALLADEAAAASEELASQRGPFPNHCGSLWDTRHHRPMRNAALTTVAPTGTLSILAGCTGGIEPAYALAFYRHVLDGQELLEVDGPFRRYARRHGFWSEELATRLAAGTPLSDVPGASREACELFVTAHQIAPAWHVRMQAAFQEHIDGAISKTINLPATATPADVDRVYQLAYDLRCKGVTVYRDGCRKHQPMSFESGRNVCPRCRRPLADEPGCSRCPHCGCTLCG